MHPTHFVSIIACARWETAYITEWLLYHRSIGFDHVYLYCNDDDPFDLYDKVLPFCSGNSPFVTFHYFPYQGQQFYMMMHALRHHKDASEWIAFLDIDEFLMLPGLDNIKEYLQRCPAHWDSVHFNWSLFGNNGYAERPAGSVLHTYTRRAERLDHNTKTITRSAKIDVSRISERVNIWHNWAGVFGPNFIAVNVLGDPMDRVAGADHGITYLTSREVQAKIRNIAVVNHYAFKSAADLDRRVKRGLGGDFSGQIKWKQVSDAGRASATMQELSLMEDTYLADYWNRQLRECLKHSVVPPVPGLPNVAFGKRADQSSISEWSLGKTTQTDAGGLLSGIITGGAQCHTSLESQPWWLVDLGMSHLIYEARVYNRVDQPTLRTRLGAFRIDIADGTGDWTTIYRNDGSRPIGGADGDPLILRFVSPPLSVTRLRIIALSYTFLHLDQVELYGVLRADTIPRATNNTSVE